jgi:tRNA(Ser,Leu) C12 N-acetylase TAN1
VNPPSRRDTPAENTIKLIITSKDFYTERKTISALKRLIPDARVRPIGFRAIFAVEAEGDLHELASRIMRDCSRFIGHVTAIMDEVESRANLIKETALKVGAEQIGQDESFAFRLNKRGSHWLDDETPKLERDIGGSIWEVLREKYGKEPKVNLTSPDVAVIAEVLGSNTAIGISRKNWRGHETEIVSDV